MPLQKSHPARTELRVDYNFEQKRRKHWFLSLLSQFTKLLLGNFDENLSNTLLFYQRREQARFVPGFGNKDHHLTIDFFIEYIEPLILIFVGYQKAIW